MYSSPRKIWVIVLLPGIIFGLDITTCDCDNPVLVGLIDSVEPNICLEPVQDTYLNVIYEIIEQVEPPLSSIGYLCREWTRQKTITGFFFGGYDTVNLETPFKATPDDCRRMALTLECDGNKMETNGRTSSFTQAPTGDPVWWDKEVYTVRNCELETFNVTQDCIDCPIKSPFGILATNGSDGRTSSQKGHLIYVWEKPVARPRHCTYTITRTGYGMVRVFHGSEGKILRDDDSQLDFIMSGKTEKICQYENCHRSESAPNVFIRYNEQPLQAPLVTTIKPTQKSSKLEGKLIRNKESKLCLGSGKPIKEGNLVTPELCNSTRAETFIYIKKKLVSSSSSEFCIVPENKNNSRNVIFKRCGKQPSILEDWTFDPEKGNFAIGNRCLTVTTKADFSQAQRPNKAYEVVNIIACEGSIVNMSVNQEWNLTLPKSKFEMLADDPGVALSKNETKLEKITNEPSVAPAITSEASHHQYEEDKMIDLVNALNNEIRGVYCEAFKNKEFVAITLSQNSPMLAGVILGLPPCQRIQATGQVMSVQQCKPLNVTVGVEKTKCGFEPKFGNYTVGKDGYTRVDYRPCLWGGFTNLNGKAYEYADNKWSHIVSNIKLATLGLATHFDETVDNEVQYLKNLETSFHIMEMDQINMIGEMMALMQHEDINAISPIILHTQSESQAGKFSDWIVGFKATGSVILGILLLVGIIFCWIKCCPEFKCDCRKKERNNDFEQSYPMHYFPTAPMFAPGIPNTSLYPPLNSPLASPIVSPTPPIISPMSTSISPTSPPIVRPNMPFKSPINSPIRTPTRKIIKHSHKGIKVSATGRYYWEDGCPVTPLQSPHHSIPEETEAETKL